LKPNDLGLFDTLGNVYEWCQERYTDYQPGSGDPSVGDIIDDSPRLLRGGAFTHLSASARSAHRDRFGPADRIFNYGFRLARTYY